MSMTTEVRQLPILFTGPMVRAILGGPKTQTRRVVKPQPGTHAKVGHSEDLGWHLWWDHAPDGPSGPHTTETAPLRCPYGQPGDLLYVRETAELQFIDDDYWVCWDADRDGRIIEDMDDVTLSWVENAEWRTAEPGVSVTKKRPGMLVPKSLSRIWLRVTDVMVERVQDITETDAISEGVKGGSNHPDFWVGAFRDLWDSINADLGYPWESNPWVWVISFDLLRGVEP